MPCKKTENQREKPQATPKYNPNLTKAPFYRPAIEIALEKPHKNLHIFLISH
jgi:hypothetical protein